MRESAREKYFGLRGPDLRRRNGRKRRTFEVTKLWDIHKEIVRRLALGEKNTDIATQLGVTPAMVSYTKNSRIVEDRVAILQASKDADTVDLMKRIQQIAPKALDLLEGVIDGDKELGATIGLRAKTAENLMDRAGYGAVKKMAVGSAHLTREEIEDLKTRARQSGVIRSPRVINVTPEANSEKSQ